MLLSGEHDKLSTEIHHCTSVISLPSAYNQPPGGVLYSIIFAGILLRTPEVNIQQRRTSFNSALAYTFTVVPILVFQVLLANKLDDGLELSYTTVVSPLFVSFATLIMMSFSSKGGNRWWFGIRKDFCHFLLSVFPLLQEYANIAYNNEVNRATNGNTNDPTINQEIYRDEETRKKAKENKKSLKNQKKNECLKPVVPVVSIDMPD
ncbi:Transmembrane protein 185B [Eumeta japonica]|uniref:Transmembrane protein 185B n=1 Tax=Eumeta variegata TaxID=151549 RepID=A0A4C1T4S2_EUMVA|nr:Transmembrane protein 185B [Eumeta japonica]